MKTRFSAFIARPACVLTTVLAVAVIVWAVSLYSIASQLGSPFPGFFYNTDRIVSAITPQDFTGWQAGLRPWDRIVAVDGQHWREMPRLVREAGIGSTLVYTVERGSQSLQIAVPTMEFSADILWRFPPGWLFFSLLCLAVGGFVYIRNPTSRLNRYLLVYLLLWAAGMGVMWEYCLSQVKWTAYVLQPWVGVLCVAGWIFFWSFPADRARKEFLARVPLIPAFGALAVATTIYFTALLFLASRLDRPEWWQVYTLSSTWGFFLIFAGGSLFLKTFPLLLIALKKDSSSLIRNQALVLLAGVALALGGFMTFAWAPLGINLVLPVNPQWGALFASLYPFAVGYAVLRYQLFDIRVVIRKGLVYSLLTATLTAVFLLLSFLSGYLFEALTGQQSLLVALFPALFVAFLFQPARGRIQTFVDHAFFHREYEVRQTLTAFSRGLSTLRERGEVVQLVVDTVTRTLGSDGVELWLSDDQDEYHGTDGKLTTALPAKAGLASWMKQERRPLLLLPDDHSTPAQDLHRIHSVLAVPLLSGEKLVGILTLGEKRAGELYTQEDIELLTTLAHSAALALENARLHEERLAIMREQLAQVTAAQEEERRRIARELHDGVGPALASLNVRLHTARKVLAQEHNPEAVEIEELAELAQSNIHDIRRLIYDLRPAVLDELGLVPALLDYLSRCEREYDLVIRFSADQEERLPAPVETALFRIAQEALNNVVKHAQAHRVDVRLVRDQARVSLCLADDGQGFDTKVPLSGTHLGLWSMRERVEQLRGWFVVESAPGSGTNLSVTIPLETQTGDVGTGDMATAERSSHPQASLTAAKAR